MIEPGTEQSVIGAEDLSRLRPLVLDGAWGQEAREYLTQARAALSALYQTGASGRAVVDSYTHVVDHVVRTVYAAANTSYVERYAVLDQRCVLIAQGGYGRGELNPSSDIDLLFVYSEHPDAYVETVTEKVLYTLWDTRAAIGHATRSLRGCVRLANQDMKVKTALLETRFLAGDQRLYAEFVAKMDSEVLRRHQARFFREKVAENERRHGKYGDSVYLVEPHLKDGEGGLRDIHTALWLAKVKFKIRTLNELVHKGVITEREEHEIEAAQDFLWRVRNGLHFLSGRQQDQLTFEYQKRLAADLGFRDDGASQGVEQFMRTYYLNAVTVNRFSEEIIGRCLERPTSPRQLRRTGNREIRPGVWIAGEKLVVTDPAVLREDPSMLIRVLADAQRHGVLLSNVTRRLIRNHAGMLDESARHLPTVVAAFFDVLRWKSGVYETLYEMHKLDVLGALFPEFGNLRCMAQYDRYHIYTVDEHSLRGVRYLEQLRRGVYKDSTPLLTDVMRNVDRIEILYLAILFHDAGKGQGGDHSNRGAAMVRGVAARLDLNADDTAQLEFLVRHHLLMHHLATRRDFHDPKLVARFTGTVGTLETLKMLYVLTSGDLQTTNPQLWNSWQDMLLADLYTLSVDVFERGVLVEQDWAERACRIRSRVAEIVGPDGGEALTQFLADMPDRYFLSTSEADIPRHFVLRRKLEEQSLATHVTHLPEREFSEFTVVTTDQPGLFSKVTGVLRAHGMNILGARIATGASGTAVDVFRVSHLEPATIARPNERWERIELAVAKAVDGEIDVERMVTAAARRAILRQKVVPRVPTRVEIDNQVSEEFTVIDVSTHDQVGLLFAITNALYHLHLSVHLAKISTSVDRVLDVFYVTDAAGRKIDQPHLLDDIRQAVLTALQQVTVSGTIEHSGSAASPESLLSSDGLAELVEHLVTSPQSSPDRSE